MTIDSDRTLVAEPPVADPVPAAVPELDATPPLLLPPPVDSPDAPPRRRFGALPSLVSRPGLVLAVLVVTLAVAWCFVPGLFTSKDPYLPDSTAILVGPSAEHLFGTDRLGRDIYSRTVHGAVITLSATLLAVAIAFVIGTALGAIAGFVGGAVELVIMRVVDVLLSVPGLLLTMVVVSALGYGTINVAIAVGVSAVANFARVMRAEVLRVVQADYIEAAASIGTPRLTILTHHVLPNSLSSVVSLVPLQFGASILAIAALGFLGFGAPPPEPEWGLLVSEGRDLLAVAPWIALLPGFVILAVVLSSNRISRELQRDGGIR
ncbi:ABC transporter permease [Rhodococcus koreensis]|uniref:ABC transporter permease n=1 Tax=Rhodococcus koreensis TaxID=99653 RepID=UPI00197D2B24|nr:ABC transporter permease [Rhodococcus koreensis]QSE78283.1 ABC transporter permease [Rhodococcus koreensis]